MTTTTPTPVGVIGVGSMGRNHARVYRELPTTELVGVYDADEENARAVAEEYDTRYRSLDDLLSAVEAVSIAVPTQYHFDTARECIDAGVDVLVEKPFVSDAEEGERLIEFADERNVNIQVGHVERFNPAVSTLLDLVEDLDIIAVDAHRLGPPLDREIDESAVMDLMIHDIDILLALVDDEVDAVDAVGNRNARYASANLAFESGVVGQLTASRVTQEKVRKLTISAETCRVTVDYIDQTLEVTRGSAPEYIREDGEFTHRHESFVEQLSVENREPLKHELDAFVESVRTGTEPPVTGEDGLRALELVKEIDELSKDSTRKTPKPATTQ
ncbi:Gfo/Idh/MocA family protein [Haloarcula amylovorans]|uniref:Gfo/Idh/MocA family protein n=1 Tax=Haloarcula amylovorans TaxID=2562280 RepID=UPI001076A7A9|nr:Gfo/Idh/MocA family oxidoreductase [Halomicroarcula amylolytica]